MKVTRRGFLAGGAVAGPLASGLAATPAGPAAKRAILTAENVNSAGSKESAVFRQAQISPSKVLAGDCVEFRIKLTVGPGYTSQSSRIIFDFPAQLGQSLPSLYHHEDNGWIEVYVGSAAVSYKARLWDVETGEFATKETASPRARGQRILVLDLAAGLRDGDTVQVNWGDAQGGLNKATQVTVLVPKEEYRNTVWVRYFPSQEEGLPDWERDFEGYTRPTPKAEVHLSFEIVPRPVDHFRHLRKAQGSILLPFDRYCNVVRLDNPGDWVVSSSKPALNTAGVPCFSDEATQVKSKRLPMTASATMRNVYRDLNLYWGDLHTHSQFSIDVIERGRGVMSPGDLMKFARDRAGLDFYAISDHHTPWRGERSRLTKAAWESIIEDVIRFDREGELLVFPGFEFGCQRGDTVCLFNYLPPYAEINRPEWIDIREVWKGLNGKDYLTIPHFHNPGRLPRGTWWHNNDSNKEPVLEIFSTHGSYEREEALESGRALCKSFRPDRSLPYFLEQGWKYGVVANSDSHAGHVGLNGVTAVFAPRLDKVSILEAYRNRHVYGTTNARIRLLFLGNGELMGSVIRNQAEKEFFLEVIGENRLKCVDLFRNGQLHTRFPVDGLRFLRELKLSEAEPSNWYVRATQVDNHVAYSSPIWFE